MRALFRDFVLVVTFRNNLVTNLPNICNNKVYSKKKIINIMTLMILRNGQLLGFKRLCCYKARNGYRLLQNDYCSIFVYWHLYIKSFLKFVCILVSQLFIFTSVYGIIEMIVHAEKTTQLFGKISWEMFSPSFWNDWVEFYW